MKKTIFLFFCVYGFIANAQHTISGTFSPANDYSWLIAYRLKAGTQVYVADTAIEKGKFTLKIPKNAEQGTYRLVYAVPQEEFNFDLIYNGKEDVILTFDNTTGPIFTASKENILFSTYLKEIQAEQAQLIAFYQSGSSDKISFENIIKKHRSIQNSYQKKSENLMVQEFIQANKPYMPTEYEPINDYIANRKKQFFDTLDFDNSFLQASGFLTDKIANYVFTALPLEQISQSETEKAIQENVKTVSTKLLSVNDTYKFHLFYSLWGQAATSLYNDTADFIYSNFLNKFSDAPDNQEIIADIETHNRLRLGTSAPEISWKIGNQAKNLSELEAYKNYVLIFWSSTCSHCLKELPALHKELSKIENLKVIAVALEENEITWRIESEKLSNFEHLIALGKWESAYAKLYNIQATPTYFILDGDKKIIAKPESDKDVVSFLKE